MKILRRAYRPEGPCPLSPVLGKPPTLPLGPRWAIKPKERFEYRMSLVSVTLPIIRWVKGSCKRGGNIINKKLHQLILQISFHHSSSPGIVDRVTGAAWGRAELKGQAEDQWCTQRRTGWGRRGERGSWKLWVGCCKKAAETVLSN